MQMRRDNHFLFRFNQFIDHSVWKSFRISPSNILCAVSPRIEQRILGERVQDTNHFLDEFHPKPSLLSIVPIRRFGYIVMKLWTKLYLPHLLKMRTQPFLHFVKLDGRLWIFSVIGQAFFDQDIFF
jgi:hypothetical protein